MRALISYQKHVTHIQNVEIYLQRTGETFERITETPRTFLPLPSQFGLFVLEKGI